MCDICTSGLLDEINRKRNWRPDRLIRWADKRGLNIKSDQLAEHFDNHLKAAVIDNTNKARQANKRKTARPEVDQKQPGFIIENKPGSITAPLQTRSADDQFLSEIIGRVFKGLIDNKFDLKIEYGFKAIEIKQKIAETTNVESMLLELLNEIRGQELSQIKSNDKSLINK